MAVRHVKVGGTRAAGNSTADDWTLANCYPTIATAMAGSTAVAGDEVILEDETHTVASMVSESLGFNGSFTIRGRTARADNTTAPTAIISGSSASGALFIFNDGTNRADIEFRDLGFTKSVTHTDATRPVGIQTSQKTGDLILTRCWFHDVDVNIGGATSWRLGMVNYASAPVAAARVMFNSVTFSNITGTFGTGNCSALFEHSNNSSLITYSYSDLKYRQITATFGGLFRLGATSSNNQIKVVGFDVLGVTLTGSYASGGAGSLLYLTPRVVTAGVEEYGSGYLRDVKMKDVLVTSHYVDAAIVSYSHTDAKNILGINVVLDSTTHDETSGIGCLLAVFGANMLKKNNIRRVRAYRCQSKFGTAVYVSNGADAVVDTVWAEECRCGNGVFYKGGNGDGYWSNLVALNNEWIDVVGTNAALVFHGHNGGSSGDTRHCKIGLRNLVAKGNTHSQGGVPISFAYDPGSYSLSAVVRDIVCRDESSIGNSIRLGTGLVNFDMAGANLAGAIDNAGTGSVTQSGTTDADVVIVGGLSMNTELDDRWPVAYRKKAA